MSTEGGNMLINLHVKNLALIKEADVDFSKGLIVLTGETGAGKCFFNCFKRKISFYMVHWSWKYMYILYHLSLFLFLLHLIHSR